MIRYTVTNDISVEPIIKDQILIEESGSLAFDVSSSQRVHIIGGPGGGGSIGETITWSQIINRPSTLAGYGITDAASSTHNHDALYSTISHNHDALYSGISHTHTGFALDSHNHDALYLGINGTAKDSEKVSGFTVGINVPSTALFTDTIPTWDTLIDKPSTFTPSTHDHDWDSIQNKPETFEDLFGEEFNIEDILGEIDISEFLGENFTFSWDVVGDTPTTLEGYGITDATRIHVDDMEPLDFKNNDFWVKLLV